MASERGVRGRFPQPANELTNLEKFGVLAKHVDQKADLILKRTMRTALPDCFYGPAAASQWQNAEQIVSPVFVRPSELLSASLVRLKSMILIYGQS